MATTHCFIPLLSKRIRVTKLDDCGRVPAANAANSFIATDGYTSVKLSGEVEEGKEIMTRRADGSLCVNTKMDNLFKRFTIEMDFCEVNPALLDFMTNAKSYLDYAGDTAGYKVSSGTVHKFFAFEMWMGLTNTACKTGQGEAGGYVLLPFVAAGTVGDITVTGDAEVTFSMSGASTRDGNAWGVGPYNVVYNQTTIASPLPAALTPNDHFLLIDTALAPPPASCNPQPMVGAGGTSTTTTTVAP